MIAMDFGSIIAAIKDWMERIRHTYNINPYIFAFLYFVLVPPYWLSFYKIIYHLKNKQISKLPKWVIMCLVCTLAPFIYVAIFGENVPWWFWILIVVLILFSGYNLYKKSLKAKS